MNTDTTRYFKEYYDSEIHKVPIYLHHCYYFKVVSNDEFYILEPYDHTWVNLTEATGIETWEAYEKEELGQMCDYKVIELTKKEMFQEFL